MSRLARRLAVLVVVGVIVAANTTALAGGGARVSVGGSDIVPPGEDANFSLVAKEMPDGTVKGQWHDQFSGGSHLHISISCLVVVGSDAWVSGVVTGASPNLEAAIGTPAMTRIKDNGTSANDTADQISFTLPAPSVDACELMLDLPLFDLNNGQAKVSS